MMQTFRRIAIVNRGEPAMRLLHAIREVNQERGTQTRAVAFYTDPDARAMFVRESDDAICLGSATFVDSKDGVRKSTYLHYEALRHALVSSGADACWVGWGFVAEHPDFADLCTALGITFIGPSGDVMRKLGDKIASKRLAEAANVPVACWSNGPVVSLEQAHCEAERLGLPLMIKATAGGGGRGIRKVLRAEDLESAFLSASTEALKAFGDGTVFFESMVVDARHVEVQIIADTHGTTWAAGVRDCTIQRRNQKVLEEAPSPVLSEALDTQLRESAIRLSRAAQYVNAGTVEYLFHPASQAFYFMEMNTRLQVEHPVTEVTAGIDLVKLQLLVASGGHLSGTQPVTTGHAIEVRVNAEDPDNDFAPSPGRIDLFHAPTGPGIRIDTGVCEGDEVPGEFDSMVAKMIAYGRDRNEAIGRLRRALLETSVVIRGGASNKAFLLELLSEPDVLANCTDVGWLDRIRAERGTRVRPYAAAALVQAAIDIYDAELAVEQSVFISSAARGRLVARKQVGHTAELRYMGQTYKLEVRRLGPRTLRVYVDGERVDATVDRQGTFQGWLTCLGRRHRIVSVVDGLRHAVEVDGMSHRMSRDEGGVVRAPAPSVTLAIQVAPGDEVAVGDKLVILEAMKMEMAVVAPCAGRVREVLVLPNVQVHAGAPLLLIDPSCDDEAQETSERVMFRALASQETDETPEAQCHSALAELKRMVLGFDVSEDEAKGLLQQRAEVCASIAPSDPAVWKAENDIFTVFADTAYLYRREIGDSPNAMVSSEEYLLSYLHAVDRPSKALPSSFVDKLTRVLRHYGVEGLERTPALEEALLFIHKSYQRLDVSAQCVFRLLERRMKFTDALLGLASGEFRSLLDHMIDSALPRFFPLYDLAREIRYRFYDRPIFEAACTEVYGRAEAGMAALVEAGTPQERRQLMDALIDIPQPLMGYLSRSFSADHVKARQLSVEVLVRRLYRNRELQHVTVEEIGDCSVAIADYMHHGKRYHVIATHAQFPDLQPSLRAIQQAASHWKNILVDIYTMAHNGDAANSENVERQLASEFAQVQMPPTVQRVCVGVASPEHWRNVRYFTYENQEQSLVSHQTHHGIHPLVAERLELWRLKNFKVQQLRAADNIYIFHAVARENPKDERLFAFVEVRDMTPVRNEAGHVVALPHLERMFFEALAGIRDFQSRRPLRDRLHWNRIILHIVPPAHLTSAEIGRIAKRLAPPAKHLGLEKTIARIRVVQESSGKPVPSVIHISDRAGTGMHLRISAESAQPVRPLTAYAQKVVQMRRMGLLYPYEIVRMLTPAREGDQAEFPPGRFVEYDLDNIGTLVPVDREPGCNNANVVVGVITNDTPKFPEGMKRVIILGDASREMGALAEPECLRIIRAIDLAESMQVPVEWFPVSSGAKIAMDVGTEGLDWVAKVLRRIVEFTQTRGEINVIVCGVNVGGQSYWNAEATMLMHTRGVLIMTPQGSMVLTGKRALDYSGGVSADDNQGIGGFERIMGPNGQAQYSARNIAEACQILLRHYEHTYVAPGERFPRRSPTTDPVDRNIASFPHAPADGADFQCVGDIFSVDKNPGRKKPFDIRSVMRAVTDQDHVPLERWKTMRTAETSVVWDTHLGGIPVCLIGIESKPLPRLGLVPGDGPDTWTGGTLFPQSSKKVARAINAASGNRPTVVLANLSGFDGSPESMRRLQLEYGAEIGRAVVNFNGPMVFCVISRYHGGAYVVFSCTLNDNMEVAAVEGSYASVIGGAPAAAVVFPGEVKARTLADARVQTVRRELDGASERDKPTLRGQYDNVFKTVYAEKQGEVAEYFDSVHSVQRALSVGSLHSSVGAENLRPYLIGAIERGMQRSTFGGLEVGRRR